MLPTSCVASALRVPHGRTIQLCLSCCTCNSMLWHQVVQFSRWYQLEQNCSNFHLIIIFQIK